MTIADKIKKLRKDNNMTQEDLAEKLNVSRQTISKWETNIVIPDANNIVSICKLFNITTDELLDYKIDQFKRKNNLLLICQSYCLGLLDLLFLQYCL